MKKIKIIGIGGTISSIQTKEGFKPGISVEALISYIPRVTEYYEIACEQLMNIDSANLQPEDWEIIAKTIEVALSDTTISGIVITHGTDTMAITSAAIAMLIRNINKPVVFTGSQIPLTQFSSDAQRNLIDAIRVAGETNIAESVIVFNSRVYRATRTTKLREYDLSAFETVNPFPLAEISKSINIIDPFIKTRNKAHAWFDGPLNPNVALIKVFPGLNPLLLEELPKLGYQGVIVEGYGAGNLPIEKRSLVSSIQKLINQNIPVVISTVCIFGRAELYLYETGKLAEDAGAISAGDMISDVALVKLMWVLGKTNDMGEIKKLMYTNIAGEINPNISDVYE